MYIYDRHLNMIDIFSLELKENKVMEYKKQILQQNKDIFYYLRTNSVQTLNQLNNDEINLSNIIYNDSTFFKNSLWSTFYKPGYLTEIDRENQINLLLNYINGLYDQKTITKVNNSNYLLLKTEEPKTIIKYKDIKAYEIANIMNIPLKLYFLYLLEKGDYKSMVKEEYTIDSNLFNIFFVKRINLNDIENLYQSGLIKGSMKDTESILDAGTKVLRRIRKEK
jgi:hypothetical protein